MPSVGRFAHKPNLDRCPIPDRDGDPCGKPVIDDLSVSICGYHAMKVYRYTEARLGSLGDDPLFKANFIMESYAARQAKERHQAESREYVVYYVQIGGHIKIGYTGHLRRRMNVYPATRRLLATEPGAWDLEAQRHTEFAEYRADVGKEWFRPGPALLVHINGLRTSAGAAPIDFGSGNRRTA